MDGRSATFAALGVAIAGIVAFFLLDGVIAGLVLFVAGVLLVVIGIFGWQDRTPAVATATGGSTGVINEPATSDTASGESVPHEDMGADLADRADWDGGGTPSRSDDGHDDTPVDSDLDAVSGVPLGDDRGDGADPRAAEEARVGEDTPVGEEVPTPHPAVGVTEAVSDPLGRGGTDSVLGAEPPAGPDATNRAEPDASDEPPPAPTMQVAEDTDDVDHVHDQPLLGHSDLVSHVRDYHEDIATDGSTIQLRLLHERAHGAPHEMPPTVRPN
jgi:hypothetical protein